MAKLYVGNLPYSTSDQDLSGMFATFGAVLSARIITDRATGRSKGFGFVELDSDQAAQNAISQLNGTQVDGRTIVVSVARPPEPRQGGGFHNRSDRRDNRRFDRNG